CYAPPMLTRSPRLRPLPQLWSRIDLHAKDPEYREPWTYLRLDGWVVGCRFVVQDGHVVVAALYCAPAPEAQVVPQRPADPDQQQSEPELVFPLPFFPRPSVGEGPVPDGGLSKRWLDRVLAISDHIRVADDALREAQRLPPDAPSLTEWILGSMV